LRIKTNDELSGLGGALREAFSLLRPGGIVAVLTYHSLEDRIAKEVFSDLAERGLGVLAHKKPQTASEDEVSRNPRARSAKLRVIEKVA
jgi:16S rRNA (cytosine1402-N4)-methyltransferase